MVFGAVITRQMLSRGPPVWLLFAAGGAATMATGVLSPAAGLAVLKGSDSVLLFLLSLFVFASALQDAGALDRLARWLVDRAPRTVELPVVLFVGLGLASAFLVNDALVVVGVPVLFTVARRLNVPARPLLLTLAFSVTVGSALTPFGNPQNLLVSLDSGIRAPVTTFLRYLLLPTAINLALGAYYLRWRFARELRSSGGAAALPREVPIPLLPRDGWRTRLLRHPVLVVFPATMATLIGTDVASALVGTAQLPIGTIAAVGAVVVVAFSGRRLAIVRRVNWEVLVLFAGLFLVVGAAVSGGVVHAAESHVPLPGPGSPVAGLAAISGSSLIGPQLVSNVPWVGLEIPVMVAAGYGPSTPVAWVALAAASTLAGNVTLLGAASNLIVADLAERSGVRIGLRTFVNYGLPLALASIGVLLACLVLGL